MCHNIIAAPVIHCREFLIAVTAYEIIAVAAQLAVMQPYNAVINGCTMKLCWAQKHNK